MPLDGDPPVAYPIYRCPVCGQAHNLEDVVADGVFLCPCGCSFRYGLAVEPLVRVRVSEAFDFQGNILRIYLKNPGTRVARYGVNVFLNGSAIGLLDDAWYLATGQESVWNLRNPPGLGRVWNEGDVLQAQVRDYGTGEVLGCSEELTWSERPWSPLVAAAGIAAAGLAVAWACSPKKD